MTAAELRAKFKECATNDPRNRTTPLERILPMLEAIVQWAEEQEADSFAGRLKKAADDALRQGPR